MSRKVRCRITGEYGLSDEFVKIDGKYYKSKKLYDTWFKEKADREAFIEMFATEFLGYGKGQVFPTILCKKLKELEFYGFDVINKTVKKCQSSIEYAITYKDFNNDSAKISYIFAIIKNNINDVYKQIVKENNASKVEHFIDDTVDIENIQTTHKEKNIKKWLEDDDDWI